MAKGSLSKTLIATAILQVFPGSFVDSDGKTVRIPTTCEGENLEIKLSFVCAKDIVGSGQASSETVTKQAAPQNTEMTDDEIKEVKELVKRLGL